ALKKDIDTLSKGVQGWCEAHRDELTQNGRTKTASLITGKVEWRNRPPSVGIRGVETVLETLRRLGLERFIRTKEEINKDAILSEPKAVEGVAGITVRSGVEDFAITPFEQNTGV
ncbi:host-nuclease inhibitor Gam family protein, partial [Salmonella enterica]|nr:host-nuclease inhibitor Gam family protein [Salmonella enterica]